jgi:hypothetical protein
VATKRGPIPVNCLPLTLQLLGADMARPSHQAPLKDAQLGQLRRLYGVEELGWKGEHKAERWRHVTRSAGHLPDVALAMGACRAHSTRDL